MVAPNCPVRERNRKAPIGEVEGSAELTGYEGISAHLERSAWRAVLWDEVVKDIDSFQIVIK